MYNSYRFCIEIKMPRGGKRKGSGRPSPWVHKRTKLIRVPAVFADQLIEIAQKLDKGEALDFETKSKAPHIQAFPTGQMSVWDVAVPPDQPSPLSGKALARRLDRSSGTLHVHKKRGNDDLVPWTRAADPDGWGWEFRADTQKYHPV